MINKDLKKILCTGILLTIAVSAVCLALNKISAIVCLVLGAVLTSVFYVCTRRRYDELNKLNNYLSLICAGNYDLNINENTEGEFSILKNNLYKVIILLQSQKEMLVKDKTYLADSLADISHQLKTPLTSITVMTDLLNDETDEEKKKEFVSVIEVQLDKINWLITNLLKISKFDAGTMELKKEDASVRKVIDESLKPFLVTLDLKNIDCEISGEDFIFKGDRSWTVEAVQNVIKNCIEHTDKGGSLHFFCRDTSVYSSLIISDTGCGISKEDLPHIFERFYHGKNSAKESVGIGLALAKTVLEKENGTISVSSVEGEGTSFEIRFYKSIV